jgi:UDP-N-acetyl-L-fucosamine synthase
MRVITVVGTRPEIIKLSRVIPALDRAVDHKIIHTGQNYDYELNEIFFKEMGIRHPDERLTISASSPSEFVGNTMMLLPHVFKKLSPDAVLILGDTNSCVAAAYVAKRLKIPVFHMEAGNRSFDERVPEEINRRIVDHISDINMPYSDLARENLIREGLPTDRVIKTGSPMREVLTAYEHQIYSSNVLTRLGLEPHEYFVVSCHREENLTELKLAEFAGMLVNLADKYSKRIVVSVHPRLRGVFSSSSASLVEFHKPFGFPDYVKLQKNAICTLSDSGTITEESSILQYPALNLRDAHERPEGMEEGSVIMTGFKNAVNCVDLAGAHTWIPKDYIPDNVSEKIARIILSYTDYVNRNVWRKP